MMDADATRGMWAALAVLQAAACVVHALVRRVAGDAARVCVCV